MYNKIIMSILMLSVLLLGCSSSNENNIKDQSVEAINEKLSQDEELLQSLKKQVKKDKSDGTSLSIPHALENMEKIKDAKIKKQVLAILEEAITKLIESQTGNVFLQVYFFPEGPEQMLYKDYLKESTIKNIYQFVYPVYYELSKQDLIMVEQDFNEDINKEFREDDQINRLDLFDWLRENEFEFEYLTNSSSPILILTEEKVILNLINEEGVPRAFKIEDKQGNNMNPYDTLSELDERLIEKAKKKSEEFNKKYKAEKEKEKKIMENKKAEGPKIGMADTEVVEVFGKPNKINRTTTRDKVKEQWVYPNNKYLYFENGILTTIQD